MHPHQQRDLAVAQPEPRDQVVARRPAPQHLDRLLERPSLAAQFQSSLPFRELAGDPLGVVRKVYAQLGETVSPAFEASVTAWLADPENAVDRYGRYPYSYEAFGLDRGWVEALFDDYSHYFGLD